MNLQCLQNGRLNAACVRLGNEAKMLVALCDCKAAEQRVYGANHSHEKMLGTIRWLSPVSLPEM